jgi:hypothetical protein
MHDAFHGKKKPPTKAIHDGMLMIPKDAKH